MNSVPLSIGSKRKLICVITLVTTTLIFSIAANIAGTSAYAQASRSMTMELDDVTGQPYTIDELGAIVIERQGKLEVLIVMPTEHRPKAYKAVDIREKDILLMLNGKKLNSIDDLKEAHQSAKVGDQFKFGVKRKDGMHMLKFDKADPDDLPKMKTMITMSEDEPSEGGMVKKTFTGKGGGEAVAPLFGSGILAGLTEDGSAVQISYLMPDAKKIFGNNTPSEGSVIKSVQGKNVSTLAEVSAAYDAIEVGETVALVVSHDGKDKKYEFKKRKMDQKPGAMMITK